MPDEPRNCVNCGAEVPAGAPYCPNCGAPAPTAEPQPTNPWPPNQQPSNPWPPNQQPSNPWPPNQQPANPWPPTPQGPLPQKPVELLYSKSVGGDVALGVFTVIGALILAVFTVGATLIAVIVTYFVVRRHHPAYARGILYGLAFAFFLILAPCLFCFAGIFSSSLTPWIRHMFHLGLDLI
jgi:hypothetical protein